MLRKMKLDDLNDVFKIEKSLFSESSRYNLDEFKRKLDDNNAYSYVLIKNNKIIGYFIHLIIDDYATICDLAISKDYQNRRLSYKLMNKIDKLNKKHNVSESNLEVEIDNTVAISLYKKCGYVIVKNLHRYYINKDGIEMKKIYKEGEGYERIFVSNRK